MTTNAKKFKEKSGSAREKLEEISPILLPCEGSDVKTASAFIERFGEAFSIDTDDSSILRVWNNQVGHEKICKWLLTKGAHFAALTPFLRITSETILYPLIINALSMVVSINPSICFETGGGRMPLSVNELDELADDVVSWYNHRTKKKSLENVLTLGNKRAVLEFLSAKEECANAKASLNKTRVEIFVHNTRPNKLLAICKADVSIDDHNEEGFFQICAYMAITGCQFGIYTSHSVWQFLKLLPTADPTKFRIAHSEKLYLTKACRTVLDEQAVEIYAHLFEMFEIPVDTDLVSSEMGAMEALQVRAARMVARIRV